MHLHNFACTYTTLHTVTWACCLSGYYSLHNNTTGCPKKMPQCRKSSCWWALKLFNCEKMWFKVGNLVSKSMTKSFFLFLPCAYWNLKHPVHLNNPLPQKKIIYDKKCFKITIKKYSNGRHQYCICFSGFQLTNSCVRIEKFQCPSARGLPEDFKFHPTFIPSANFVGVMAVLNIGAYFWGHPVGLKVRGVLESSCH